MKKNLLIAIILIVFAGIPGHAFCPSQKDPIAGGYAEADKTDPEVVAAARFAIKQKRRQIDHGALVSIERAEVQVVAGLNYRLCLKVKIKGQTRDVTAVVYKNLKQKYVLSSWDANGCKAAE